MRRSKSSLDDIKKMLLTRVFAVSATSVKDLDGVIDVAQMSSRIESQQAMYETMFGPDLSEVLEGLAKAMKDDLNKKF